MDSYQPRVSGQRQQTYFVVKDLESLSAGVLYTGKIDVSVPKKGMTLPGGLAIKDIRKETITLQQDFGGVGNIYTAHPDGNGATRFYGNKIVKGVERKEKRQLWKNVWKK